MLYRGNNFFVVQAPKHELEINDDDRIVVYTTFTRPIMQYSSIKFTFMRKFIFKKGSTTLDLHRKIFTYSRYLLNNGWPIDE